MGTTSRQLRRDLKRIEALSEQAQKAAMEAEDTLAALEDREARRALRQIAFDPRNHMTAS